MGYESRLYIVERNELKNTQGEVVDVFAQKIASYDLCKMGADDFRNNSKLFKTPIDFDLYITRVVNEVLYDSATKVSTGSFIQATRVDDYGDSCCYAHIEDVLKSLYKLMSQEDYYVYWRMKPLIMLLEALSATKNNNLLVVHYGY